MDDLGQFPCCDDFGTQGAITQKNNQEIKAPDQDHCQGEKDVAPLKMNLLFDKGQDHVPKPPFS
jgi:hypothetical protein